MTYSIPILISTEEVSECLPSATTAPGPDGFPARLWCRLPCNLIPGLFNLFVAYGSLPPILVKSRTVFVAKKGDPQCPGNYQPISIASVAIRHFHRFLARRLERLSLVDERQRAFRRTDGVAENLFLLQSVPKDSRSSCKGLCLASLDLSKAFDSVTHDSIASAMRRVGLDQRFVDYIRGTYEQSETFLQVYTNKLKVIDFFK
uniref:Retrovirus-related Pol polyprotein from type-1 retrotransposable element R2 n=1 Tax=Schizaphis graminum TaxID=13262 RepID=A0A2S2N7Z3_SCHGA